MKAIHIIQALKKESDSLTTSDDPVQRMMGDALLRVCSRAFEFDAWDGTLAPWPPRSKLQCDP